MNYIWKTGAIQIVFQNIRKRDKHNASNYIRRRHVIGLQNTCQLTCDFMVNCILFDTYLFKMAGHTYTVYSGIHVLDFETWTLVILWCSETCHIRFIETSFRRFQYYFFANVNKFYRHFVVITLYWINKKKVFSNVKSVKCLLEFSIMYIRKDEEA